MTVCLPFYSFLSSSPQPEKQFYYKLSQSLSWDHTLFLLCGGMFMFSISSHWPLEQTQYLHFAMPNIEALVFKLWTIGFDKQFVWLHPCWITSLSHFPHLSCSLPPYELQEQGEITAVTFVCLSVCLPHPLQPACSRPSWWITSESRSTASKCSRKKVRTSRRSIDREWHFTTWVTTTRPSTTWKRQDPASQQVWGAGGGEQGCGFTLRASAFLFMTLSLSLTWLLWFPQGWAWLTVSLAILPFKHSGIAARLQWPNINHCGGCSITWKMTGLLECRLCQGDPASLSLPSLFLKKKAGWWRVCPDHYIFWLFENKLFLLSKVRRLFVISNSHAFHHPSKGLVL